MRPFSGYRLINVKPSGGCPVLGLRHTEGRHDRENPDYEPYRQCVRASAAVDRVKGRSPGKRRPRHRRFIAFETQQNIATLGPRDSTASHLMASRQRRGGDLFARRAQLTRVCTCFFPLQSEIVTVRQKPVTNKMTNDVPAKALDRPFTRALRNAVSDIKGLSGLILALAGVTYPACLNLKDLTWSIQRWFRWRAWPPSQHLSLLICPPHKP
jgi:hypothetical protein